MPAPYAFTRFREIRAVVAGAKKKRGGGEKKKGKISVVCFPKRESPRWIAETSFCQLPFTLKGSLCILKCMYVCLFVFKKLIVISCCLTSLLLYTVPVSIELVQALSAVERKQLYTIQCRFSWFLQDTTTRFVSGRL